jgi:hypothetical protein
MLLGNKIHSHSGNRFFPDIGSERVISLLNQF